MQPKPSKRQRIRAKGTDVPALLETFEELATRYKISRVLLRNVADLGYEAPTPVQRQAIPAMLEVGSTSLLHYCVISLVLQSIMEA